MTQKHLTRPSLAVLLLLCCSQATASTIVLPAAPVLTATNGQYVVTATPYPPTLLPAGFGVNAFSMSVAEQNILKNGSAAGNFDGDPYPAVAPVASLINGGALNGAFHFITLSAGINGASGGLIIGANAGVVVHWEPGAGDPVFAENIRLDWIQFIHTNKPIGAFGNNVVYLDPGTPDDGLPFYWTTTERTTLNLGYYALPSDTSPRFSDGPRRALADAPVTWTADLFLVSYDSTNPANSVTVYDGVSYGFTITAVPEPSTLILVLITMCVGIAVVAQKRRARLPLWATPALGQVGQS